MSAHILSPPSLNENRKAVKPAYFALPPLAAFLVAFFLAIAPPFPEDETLNARRQLMLPTKFNRRHHSQFALLREPYHRLRAESHITVRMIALQILALPPSTFTSSQSL